MPKPLTTHHAPPTGTIDWKEILLGVTTIDAIHLITPKRVKLPPAEHLFITIQSTAAREGATLGDNDQMPKVRPTQAVSVTTTTHTDVAMRGWN